MLCYAPSVISDLPHQLRNGDCSPLPPGDRYESLQDVNLMRKLLVCHKRSIGVEDEVYQLSVPLHCVRAVRYANTDG